MPDGALSAGDPGAQRHGTDPCTVLRAVARLASLAATEGDPDDTLRELCRVAALTVEVDGVGVVRRVADDGAAGPARVVHAGTTVRTVERLQEALGTGPCHDAMHRGDVVAVRDVDDVGERYGEVAAGMLRAGMRAVLAVPLVGRGVTWGSLDLYRRRPGDWHPDEVETARLLADIAASCVMIAADRDEARTTREELEHRALHDALTGVPNRVLLFDRIRVALAAAARRGTLVGIAFIDLDRFKRINDTLGHAAGDDVLVEVARRLESVVRSGDTLARLAGDEFVVVLADLPVEPAARAGVLTALTGRLRAVLGPPIRTCGTSVVVTASIGVVVPDAGWTPSPDALVHEADVAMYGAKGHRDAVVVRDRTPHRRSRRGG